MCFREACTTYLSQVGRFELGTVGERQGDELPTDTIDKVLTDDECFTYKGVQRETRDLNNSMAFLGIEGTRLCGYRFMLNYKSRKFLCTYIPALQSITAELEAKYFVRGNFAKES